jgi:hypothetical protein
MQAQQEACEATNPSHALSSLPLWNCRALPTAAISAMQRQHVLLRLALDRHEAHRRPSYCFTDRFGVTCIVLVRFHIRTPEARTHQLDLMTASGNLAGPIVRAATRLHRHQARAPLRHERQQLPTPEPTLHDCPALPIHAVNLKQILGQVDSQRRNIHLRTLPR